MTIGFNNSGQTHDILDQSSSMLYTILATYHFRHMFLDSSVIQNILAKFSHFTTILTQISHHLPSRQIRF